MGSQELQTLPAPSLPVSLAEAVSPPLPGTGVNPSRHSPEEIPSACALTLSSPCQHEWSCLRLRPKQDLVVAFLVETVGLPGQPIIRLQVTNHLATGRPQPRVTVGSTLDGGELCTARAGGKQEWAGLYEGKARSSLLISEKPSQCLPVAEL